MDRATEALLARRDQFEAKQHAAIAALAALIEDPETGNWPARQAAFLEALRWLEAGALCDDCVEGRCHWGGEKSRASIAAAKAGHEYTEPCGCARHEISVQARQRRARLQAAGILP